MHQRRVRMAVFIAVVGVMASSFGSAAEGKRPTSNARSAPSTDLTLSDTEIRWCSDGEHVPAILETVDDLGTLRWSDHRWLWMIRTAAADTVTIEERRTLGSMYTALRGRWSAWDRVCRAAYAER